MTTIRRWRQTLAAAGLMLIVAHEGHAADAPLTIIAGEESLGEVLVDMSVEIYTDQPDAIQHFIGGRYSAGGRNGLLGTFTVTEVMPPDCSNTTLTLSPEVPSGFFVAYSRPAQFASLRQGSDLREAVSRELESALRAAGGVGEFVPYAIWKFEPAEGASTLVFAAIRTLNYRDESWGVSGGFDAIALLKRDGTALSVLDTKVWLATPDNLSTNIDIMAVARNPVTGRDELYLRYQSFEYLEYVGYDISGGRLQPAVHTGCW